MGESTVDLDKFPYELHVEDVGYFSDCSDYSKTGEDLEAPVRKISLVYKDLDDFSGVSCPYKIFSPRRTNVIECELCSNLNYTYFKDSFSMYPFFKQLEGRKLC